MPITCAVSGESFDVLARESALLERLGLSLPTLSPLERLRRRTAHRNERHLYHRQCGISGKRVVSTYRPESIVVTYDREQWWSDRWDARTYGREIDFTRPLFEQFAELRQVVPRLNMMLSHSENCDYSPYSVYCKNCYLSVSLFQSEEVHYSYQTNYSRDCLDCTLCRRCELCYESVNCWDCFEAHFCEFSENCSSSWFLKNCIGCTSCFGCCNLRNKQYYFLNTPMNRESYAAAVTALSLDTRAGIIAAKRTVAAFFQSQTQPYRYAKQNEEVTGDNIQASRNSRWCFDGSGMEDCSYIFVSPSTRIVDCSDCNYTPNAELTVEALSGVNNHSTFAVMHAWDIRDSMYADECFYSSDLMFCVGLRHARFCILNRSYPQDTYQALRTKLVSHLKNTGEWGEFFSARYSLVPYQDSLAAEHFPLTDAEIIARGLVSAEVDVRRDYQAQATALADRSSEARPDITNQLLACLNCQRNYKLQLSELRFYQKCTLPLPALCPNCRHAARVVRRHPWRLFQRSCSSCATMLETPLSTEQASTIACERCYESVVQ